MRIIAVIVSVMLLCAGPVSVHAQTDTALLEQKRLDAGQLSDSAGTTVQSEVFLGDRFLKNATRHPYFLYTVTKEDIRRNAVSTLADVLKMAPGIRVSQPGNALDGETFLQRGLPGNGYTRILLNGLPLRPVIAGGVSIGTQLPVKEAERIEILYGPGGALFGADYLGGVINIVTKTTEKPVFMQADLTIGGGLYSGINVMFGGKIGRDKQIFRFTAYGSNTIFDDRRIFYSKNYLYNPATYPGLNSADTSFVDYENYDGTLTEPSLSNTPHLSRLFGFQINYRSVTFSVETLYRRDHSAIGYSPLARSYNNPLTYTGEGITRVNLNFQKLRRHRSETTDFTYHWYRLDPRSTYLAIRPEFLKTELQASEAYVRSLSLAPDSAAIYRDAYQKDLVAYYGNGLRYQYAESNELRFGHVRHYEIGDQFTLSAGVYATFGLGVPYTELLRKPVDRTFLESLILEKTGDSPVAGEGFVAGEGQAFAQLSWEKGRFKTWLGGVYHASNYSAKPAATPRWAASWVFDEHFVGWANAGGGSRIPAVQYQASSYTVRSDSLYAPLRTFTEVRPEKSWSAEGGLRWEWRDRVSLNCSVFYQRFTALMTYRRTTLDSTDVLYVVRLGYDQPAGDQTVVSGFQASLQFGNFLKNNLLEGMLNVARQSGSATVGGQTTDYVPGLPAWINQLRLILHLNPRTVFIFDNVLVSPFYTRTVAAERITGFYTLDALARYDFNERFQVYGKITNIFGQPYAGISATGTPNDLHYNPQTQMFVKVGMVYVLE